METPLSLRGSQRAASELRPLLCVACCCLWAAGGSSDHTLAWKRDRFQSRLLEGRGLKFQQGSFPVTQDRGVTVTLGLRLGEPCPQRRWLGDRCLGKAEDGGSRAYSPTVFSLGRAAVHVPVGNTP